VGVKILDEQHAEFVKCLNQLHAAMLKGNAQSVAIVIEPRMKDLTNHHFSTEERLMEDTKFPGLAEHRAEHIALAAKVEEFVARYQQGDQTMYPQLLRFVGNWLHNHTLTVDKQYTVWMNNHGVH
jgi:hemerythrin